MASLDAEKPDDEPEALTDEQVLVVNDNLGLVGRIARGSRERRLDFDDRFQAGCIGLIRAVKLWDPAKGTLATYSEAWIKSAIQRAASKAPDLSSIDSMAEDGYEPLAPGDPIGIDPDDAIRLRAIVVSLPEQARRPIIDRFWRGRAPRGGAVQMEAVGLRALRRATWGGRQIPGGAPTWSAPDGRPIPQDGMSPEDTATLKAMAGLKLQPRFPVTSFVPGSECAHKGPLPRGSLEYCPCCHASGQDGVVIPTDVQPLPRDKPKHVAPAARPKQENRKQRRQRARGDVLAKAG